MSVLGPETVNDVHSRLNHTRVAGVFAPQSLDELQRFLQTSSSPIALSGHRHAMGGQQFAEGKVLLDLRRLNRFVSFNPMRGHAEFEGGANWPYVMAELERIQAPAYYEGGSTATADYPRWTIRQKQTGADDFTLAGSLSANIHGRGLRMGPICEDVERITLLTPFGEKLTCSRTENAELFSLVLGGYGLFGIIATVTLRLTPRQKLRRLVDVLDVEDALRAVERRVEAGALYGDFQYAIDPTDDSFLKRGIFACYVPAGPDAPDPDPHTSSDLTAQDWTDLLRLAHTDKRTAFSHYARHYLDTHGNVYFSDSLQLSTYIPSYHAALADISPPQSSGQEGNHPQSLVIGEMFVPPDALPDFLACARQILRTHNADDIYGTIRSVHPDTTTFLPYATRHYASIIFNLRTVHTYQGINQTAGAFKALQQAALDLSGSFYLTYHRHHTREQLLAAYPQLPRFLELKKKYDPTGRLTSDWHKHLTQILA